MDKNELIKSFMEYRCTIYYWLKNLYITEPSTKTLLEIVNTCKVYEIDDTIPNCEKEFINFFAKLNEKEVEKLHNEIKVEYARLFLGPKKIPAPPFESVYTTKTRHMFGESTTEVRELYKNAGLKLETKDNLPDDFIGYELEFMYYLSYETIKALEENNEEKVEKILKYQYHFLKEHLNVWIKDFTKDILDNTTNDYFRVTAKLTAEFIKGEYNNLKELI